MGLSDLFSSSLEKELGKVFDKAVRDVDELCGGSSLLAGVMTFSALSDAYKSLEYNYSIIQKSGLSPDEYQAVLWKVFNKKGRKYISNWDQMMRGSRINSDGDF